MDLKTLIQCRQEIDEIDQQMIELFQRRMNVAKEVVMYKIKHQLEIFQPEREQAVIDKNLNRISQDELLPFAKIFIQNMMDISKDYQSDFIPSPHLLTYHQSFEFNQNTRVGFQGVEGSFSRQALADYFTDNVTTKKYEHFEDVFKALNNDEIDYGIVPIENSSTGSINDVYDLIRKNSIYIVGQQNISITQHLLGTNNSNLESIKEVYSHPQALAQCSNFLNQMHYKQIPYTNTATSAQLIASLNDCTKSAIASLQAAKLYNLKVLKQNIHNAKTNHTRFIVIGRRLENSDQNNRISIVCTLKHEVGSLCKVLEVIKNYELNMVHIESRPLVLKPWEYYFYIDFEGNLEHENVKKAMKKINEYATTFKVLGTYIEK